MAGTKTCAPYVLFFIPFRVDAPLLAVQGGPEVGANMGLPSQYPAPWGGVVYSGVAKRSLMQERTLGRDRKSPGSTEFSA